MQVVAFIAAYRRIAELLLDGLIVLTAPVRQSLAVWVPMLALYGVRSEGRQLSKPARNTQRRPGAFHRAASLWVCQLSRTDVALAGTYT
ncbi:hypothetical protein FV140_04310 [Paenarthrobacter ureafaciens]|nr:hypothetical protein FV140_04310 [Paenarthrobacter ureafaciens]